MVLHGAIEMSPERDSIINTQETFIPRARASKGRAARRQRYIQKDGHCNIAFQQTSGNWGHYMVDIYTTLVEIRWRIMFLVFFLAYIMSWLIFGLLYWLIAHVHGDLGEPNEAPCVANVHSFTGAFLFSMETQATIGYGFRGMTENCMVAIVVVTVQDVLSCFIDTAIIGVVIAKMACARKRAHTVSFSKCAIINLQNGALCLQWRVGDFRGNHIQEGEAQGQLVHHRLLPTGEVILSHQDLKLQCKSITLATPASVVHKIDCDSPLYSLSPQALAEEDFELVVSFTYTDDSVGMLRQTRASYTPEEIRWGQHFQDMLRLGRKHYHVDYSLFHQTTWVQVPMMSAQERDRNRGLPHNGESVAPVMRRKIQTCQREKSDTLVLEEAWL
ncbi:inward rectifier potassium channel 16-like [Clupea harengus]|uniref:Inward rectifier potassium channel 16-like n=1 Tax=Clupea harengus TaxID=7950 RepID=A0A6P8G3L0_CLUHA|nr:inward rectifier potassium channel 16-like [Clupea harengus]XP_031430440.1 inward rectifier potassium channel 16-like [Clupea harengus]